MSRWSRRWAAGESAKERLKGILEEAAAVKNAPKGSPDQLIGDFYGACMDEAAVDRLGATPIAPMRAEIAALRDPADVGRMITRFESVAIYAPFALVAGSDNHNPSDVIAQIFAAGLGLPDRDYYLKTEPRFVEAREKYVAHVEKMLALAGAAEADARAAAATILRIETALAQASLDNVALRDPRATDHKTTMADLQKLTPRFDWPAAFQTLGVRPGDVNVAEPKFLAEFDRQLGETSLADWKTYLDWHLLDSAAPALSSAIVGGRLGLQRRLSHRRQGDEAALETLRRVGRPAPRRSPRAEVRREVLSAGRQSAHAGDGEEPPARDAGDHQGPLLDERGDEEARAREALDLQPEDRVSRPLEGLQPRGDHARVLLGRRRRRPEVQRRRRPRDDREAGRPRPVGH